MILKTEMHTYSFIYLLEMNYKFDASLDIKPVTGNKKINKLEGQV